MPVIGYISFLAVYTLSHIYEYLFVDLYLRILQGLDALGLATLDSITSAAYGSLPFSSSLSKSVSFMNDDDITTLRTFNRLLLLLNKFQGVETSNEVTVDRFI